MSLIIINVENAKAEVQKFIDLCDNVIQSKESPQDWYAGTSKHTGALRRSSMDLTRSLAKLRANKVTDRNA